MYTLLNCTYFFWMNILNTSMSSDLYFVKMLIHFLLPFLLILTIMLNAHTLRQQRSTKDKIKLRTRFSLETDWIRKLLSHWTNGFVLYAWAVWQIKENIYFLKSNQHTARCVVTTDLHELWNHWGSFIRCR